MWVMFGMLASGFTIEAIGTWMVVCLHKGLWGGRFLLFGTALAFCGLLLGLSA